MKIKYCLMVRQNKSQNEKNIRIIKLWSPDYRVSFKIPLPSNSDKDTFKSLLKSKMIKLIKYEQSQFKKIITNPNKKSDLKRIYRGQWVNVAVEADIKKGFFYYILPALAHVFNLVSLICGSIMVYYSMIITTTNFSGGQLFSFFATVIGTSVALIIYSFSNVTLDMSKIGLRMDNGISRYARRWWNTYVCEGALKKKFFSEKSAYIVEEEIMPIVSEFCYEDYSDLKLSNNKGKYIIYGTTGELWVV